MRRTAAAIVAWATRTVTGTRTVGMRTVGMRMRRRLAARPPLTVAACVAVALGLSGCGLLEADARSKDLCIQETDLASVPAAPAVRVPSTPAVTLRIDVSAALPDTTKKGIALELRADAITLGSTTGNVDFSGVETATLTVLPPPARSDLQPIVFRYQRASPAPAQAFALTARPAGGADVAPYLEAGALRVSVSFSGVAPQRAWTATLEICGSTRVTVNYWDRLTG